MKKTVKFFIILSVSILIIIGTTLSVKALYNDSATYSKEARQIDILDNETIATYSYTYDNIDVYVDTQQTEYLVKDNATLGFIKKLQSSNVSRSAIITQQQALTIGQQFINSKISNFNNYTLSSADYNNDYGEYSFIFTKKLLNYDTMDLIFVAISSSGSINAFYAVNSGEFDNYNNITLNENDITNFINQEINSKYYNQVEEINELGRTFKKDNNELILEIIVEVSLENGTIVGESLTYYL